MFFLNLEEGKIHSGGRDPNEKEEMQVNLQKGLLLLLSHVRLCNPMDSSTPGLLVHHQLPELTQTHVHHIGDAIQPSHALSSPLPPAFNLSQNQGLF